MKKLLFPFFFFLGCIQPLHTQQLNIDEGSTFAVVVGISNYQDEDIPDLQFADRDAQAFANFMRSPAGGSLDEDHLKVLVNENATAAQLAIALDWLWEVAQENDKVIIYFSGHGDVERKSITQPGYLLCWDAPARVYMAGGAFDIRVLKDVVSTLSIQNKAKVILITDACRAGKLSGSSIGGTQATAAKLATQFANEIKILSCQPDEYSREGEQWGGGRGAFSYHLLDGLYGMADDNEDLSVNLLEIGRYLEDNVSREVAPESQFPMTIGSRGERLTTVFPQLLEELKEGRKGHIQLFTATESRGIEDNVLAQADSNIVEMYLAFKQALKDQQFLEPATACAEYYYEKLSREPQLERLHSTMRRNYAAALQDDAQQVMNTILKSGLTEQILKAAKAKDIYKNYPAYIERAADLLGMQHYMYPSLHARKLFFEGQIETYRKVKRSFYQKALKIQPDMAHAMVEIIRNCEAGHRDSAEHYFHRATELIPSWIEPYIAMADFYRRTLKESKGQEEMLNLAGQIDSTSVLVWYKKGNFYKRQKKYEKAEYWYLKAINSITKDICFPCLYANLGYVYKSLGRYREAEHLFKEIIRIDSTFVASFHRLGLINFYLGRFAEAEKYFKEALNSIQKAIEIKPQDSFLRAILGNAYTHLDRLDEAKVALDKAIEINANFPDTYFYLAQWHIKKGQHNQAWITFEVGLKKGLGNGRLGRHFLKTHADFDLMRKDPRWKKMMEKYFPGQVKE